MSVSSVPALEENGAGWGIHGSPAARIKAGQDGKLPALVSYGSSR
jgi:hypothetical protein